MPPLRPILTSVGDNTKYSFFNRLYQRLEDALQDSTEVLLRLPWGGLTGVPIYLDPTCVEIVYVHVDVDGEDEPSDEISWRTVWLVRLKEIIAISYLSEGWSKERFDQLLNQEAAGTKAGEKNNS
ncbi:MAG: hypothetical protein F6K19_45405 [Cyanothece sp. SIO1E1]|nr:hypothetical protein [Cyanothece sp. SIO1E1]